MTRRSNSVGASVTYAAVGASSDPNVVRYPPAGFTGHSEQMRIGIGEACFTSASDALLSWQAQRRAGIEVTEISQVEQNQHPGVRFDDAGNPLGAAVRNEQSFTDTGEPFIEPGTCATLTWRSRRASRRVRTIYTVNEERRTGIALGTLDQNGVIGEELFWVEIRPDASVWAGVRGFLAAPEAGWLGLKQVALVRLAIASSRAQVRALMPARLSETN